MSNEQAFEQHGDESLPPAHRVWREGEFSELDLARMVEQHDVMKSVNQRLSEHRSQPFRRTLGDIGTWSSSALLLLLFQNSGYNPAFPGVMLALWLYNRNLHALDLTTAALNLQEFDKRWLGPLFEALSWPNKRIRRIIRLKLLNLLPMLTESDSYSLNQKQRAAIYSVLENSRDIDLKVAILKALIRFGDSAAIPIVEKLAAARFWTRSGYKVRREALICLPRLREQALKPANRCPEHSVSMETVPTGIEASPLIQADRQVMTSALNDENSALAKLEAEKEKVARPAMRMAFLVANWCVIAPFTLYQTISSFASHQPLQGLVWTGATVVATQLYRISLSNKRVAMMRTQVQLRDIRGVGLLAEALTWPEQDLQYEAASALTVLLPLLKANHASLLSASQRECLHQVLTLQNARQYSDLIVAILQAFQQVGDTAAIPFVERLAGAEPRTPQEDKVVREAKECLPYLRLCADNNSASHSLLRASAMDATCASDNLLRPAWESPETRPEQLLRPSDLDAH